MQVAKALCQAQSIRHRRNLRQLPQGMCDAIRVGDVRGYEGSE
jgi:hypothetical protein